MATSELAHNTIKYGGGGEVQLEMLSDGLRECIFHNVRWGEMTCSKNSYYNLYQKSYDY